MKFARFLQDTQTPEWTKAYIGYHRLQAELETIRGRTLSHADAMGDKDLDHTHNSIPNPQQKYDEFEEAHLLQGRKTFIYFPSRRVSETDPETNGTTDLGGYGSAVPMRSITTKQKRASVILTLLGIPSRATERYEQVPRPCQMQTPHTPVFPLFKDSGCPAGSPLYRILSDLPTDHIKFFDMLDAELAKVEIFYIEREKEMYERAKLLREQLDQLEVHRQVFYESSIAPFSTLLTLSPVTRWFSDLTHQPRRNSLFASDFGHDECVVFVDLPNPGTRASEHQCSLGNPLEQWKKDGVEKRSAMKDPFGTSEKISMSSFPRPLHRFPGFPPKYSNTLPTLSFGRKKHVLNPREYQCAKRHIREAVVEHYRCLEVLNNYGILNLTGFRKVLKKYEKVAKVSVLDACMKEKVQPSVFGSGALVTAMLEETEHLFAEHFECGNRKEAISHLRVDPLSKTYHFIILRSTLWLGLALPAIAGGSYLSFQEYTRRSLPSWNILLYIYSILVVPVLLALLIGFDVLIWTRKRVNYAFILQLNTRSKLDYRAYFELPSFLLCTLAYAFWFSLAQIGHPTLWPLIWLILALMVMFNPVRSFMQGHARWWTIKNIANLGASALRCVKFADVWLGDQMCSLVYAFSNLYFLGCFYTRFASGGFPSLVSSAYDLHAQEAWSTCNVSRNLQWYCLLGMSPFMIRFLQCLKQYHDSKLPTHLIGAGKYAMGMIQYFCYCYWRYQAGPRTGQSYILMCFTAAVNSIYACTWDFLMDWSMFKPHARYPLLRPELVYKSHIPCYYFALLTNLCIRFTWLTYVFSDEVDYDQHTFIVALLEVLRRVQWNIYRLENKHLDNMKQYHITQDVPLPYNFDTRPRQHTHSLTPWLK